MEKYIELLMQMIDDFVKKQKDLRVQPYKIRYEIGSDDAQGAGINIYDLDYDTGDGQYMDTTGLKIEYYEGISEVLNNVRFPTKIKNRAKIFYNWLNQKFSVHYSKPGAPSDEYDVMDVRVRGPLTFYETDKKQIVGIFEVNISKRNDILLSLEKDNFIVD